MPLSGPAPAAALAAAERALGLALPVPLRALLAQCDGVRDRYRTSVVWPASEIARNNLECRANQDFRRLYMPFDGMLFIGEAGNGDQFFLRILDGAIPYDDVYLWDHEMDQRTWHSSGFERFLDTVLAAEGER